MAGFLHFVECDTADAQALGDGTIRARRALRDAGLGDQYGDSVPITVTGGAGPGGRTGVIVANSRTVDAARVRYTPETQTWLKRPGSGGYCGFFNGDPPTPEDLARDNPLDGHWVELTDGRQWLCPVARAYHEQDDKLAWSLALPHQAGIDEKGNWVRTAVVPRFKDLWEAAERWFAALTCGEESDESVSVTFENLYDSALLALRTNYRLDKAEVALLGLFDDRTAANVMNALVDWPTLVAWYKKKARTGGNAPAG